MKPRSDVEKKAIARACIAGLALAPAFVAMASCARSEEKTASLAEDAQTLPPPSVPDAEADARDAGDLGCDAGDPTCTTELVSCDEVAWCSVPADVSVNDLLTSVWGSGPADVWAAGSGGMITHYDGTAWKRTSTKTIGTFFGIWGSGPNDLWAVSDTQTILHTDGWKSGQAAWTSSPSPIPPQSTRLTTAIWGSGPDDVRIGGETYRDDSYRPGNMLITSSGGESAWSPTWDRTGTVLAIWGSSRTDVWMLVDNSETVSHERGQTLHGTVADAGTQADGDTLVWTPVDSQSPLALRGIWGSSASDIWSVGDHGTIRHLTPASSRWQPIASPTTEDLRGVWGSGPNDVWIVGGAGTILHYDGAKFESSSAQLPLGRKPDLWGVWGSGPNDVWVVGDSIALHYAGPKTRGGR